MGRLSSITTSTSTEDWMFDDVCTWDIMGLHSQIDFKEAKHIDDTQTESFEHCHRISWKIQDGMTPHVLRNWDKGFGDGQRIPSGPNRYQMDLFFL